MGRQEGVSHGHLAACELRPARGVNQVLYAPLIQILSRHALSQGLEKRGSTTTATAGERRITCSRDLLRCHRRGLRSGDSRGAPSNTFVKGKGSLQHIYLYSSHTHGVVAFYIIRDQRFVHQRRRHNKGAKVSERRNKVRWWALRRVGGLAWCRLGGGGVGEVRVVAGKAVATAPQKGCFTR